MTVVFEETMARLGLTARPQQLKLIELTRETLASTTNEPRFVQAGTGVGKSYVLLTTALEAARKFGKPTVVVCPTNALIDQYVHKDAPVVRGAAGGKFAHIKGRSRYVCSNARAFERMSTRSARQEYWSLTRRGSLEWADLGLDNTYACPGSPDCDRASAVDDTVCTRHNTALRDGDGECACEYTCGAFEAKRLASTADVVITNGHVLVWDRLVRQFTGGAAALLPDAGAVFVDECHELESVGRDCLSDEIKPGSKVYDVVTGLREWVDKTAAAMQAMGQTEALLTHDDDITWMAAEAEAEATALEDQAAAVGVDPALAKTYRREAARLMRFVNFVAADDNFLSIIEVHRDPPHGVTLRRRCVNAVSVFREILGDKPSVLVSGTVPNTAPKRLGFRSPVENVGHPFDYSKSTLAVSQYHPKDRAAFLPRVEQVAQAINSVGGGTLVLFTSWADIDAVVPALMRRLDPGVRDRVYVQSKDDSASLKQDVADFAADGNAVLIGVRSLFTGLDVPGPALRQVVLWKLPYDVPTLEWKAIERVHGRQCYFDAMLTVLVQGVGRLVRSTDDVGRVFIADARASGQRWGASHLTAHLAEFTPWVKST